MATRRESRRPRSGGASAFSSLRIKATSVASNVDIAEDARFKFQIIQPVLNHIAYADNASQLAVVNHRHVTHVMAGHQAHEVSEIIPEGRGYQTVRHDVLYLHGRDWLAVLRKGAHDITFGDNTDNSSSLVTTRAPTFFARNQSVALLMLASGAIVATSIPFRSKMLSTFMTVYHVRLIQRVCRRAFIASNAQCNADSLDWY
jgi:hypothetical protein